MAHESANSSGPDAAGSPEKHWAKKEPEAQPARDEVIGLRRLVIEIKDRMGPAATPEQIASELQARGVEADQAEVARALSEKY